MIIKNIKNAVYLALSLVILNVTPVFAHHLTFVEVQKDGVNGVDGLAYARSVAISPDGKNVYVASEGDDAVAVFNRDSITGALTFVEVQIDDVNGVDGLFNVYSVTVSPDGKNVYAASHGEDAVVVFARDSITGALTFVEFHEDDKDIVDGLFLVWSATVSPDGKHVYVASEGDDAVAVFNRDLITGALTFVELQLDDVNGVDGLNYALSVTVSPDGKHVYAAGKLDDAVAVFDRDSVTGALTFVEVQKDGVNGVDGLDGASFVTVSPDGKHVYAAGHVDDAVAVFIRDSITGALTFVEVQLDDVNGVDGLNGVYSVTVSPDGKHVYAASIFDHAVAVFDRDSITGALTFVEVQKDDVNGVDGLRDARSVTVSPDGKHVYGTGRLDDAIAVFDSGTAKEDIIFNINNIEGGATGLEGTWRVDLFDSNGDPVEQYYSTTTSIDMALAVGDYTAKVHFLYDDGQGIWEYWGQIGFSVTTQGDPVDFTRDMPWLGSISPWKPSVSQNSTLSVTCTLKNEISTSIDVKLEGQIGGGNVMTSNIVTVPGSSTVDVTIQFNELPGYGVWPIRYWVKADPASGSGFTITDHSVFGGYLTVEGEGNSQSNYLCMDYQDEDGNLWQIGFDFNDPSNDEWFYDPQNTFKNIKYYKNGNRVIPSPSELQVLLNRVAHKFSIFYPHIVIGELFDTDYGIWRQPCGFSWACGLALVDFDDNERKAIYKDLIWDAITSRNHPFLNAEYKVPDKTPYVSSAMPLKISSFIDELWDRYSGAIGTEVQALNRMKKVLLIAEKAQQDQSLADEIKAESKQLDKTVSMLQTAGKIGDIGLHTIQNIVLMDFLSSTGFAENRLSTLKEAYNYVKLNIEGQIDPVLLQAMDEVESELENNLSSLGNLIVSSFLEATEGNLGNSNYVEQELISIAAESKLAKKLVGSVAKNMKLSESAVATAVMDAISGLTTVMELGDDWRRIILSGMLSKTVLLYAKNDTSWHAAAYPPDGLLTFQELQKHQIRDVFDLQSVFAYEYLSRGLALVESDWISVLQDALDSTLDQAASPPYAYPINYASTAVVFGQQVGIAANSFVYSDSLNAARDMLISIIDEAEKKNEAINQWAIMMANSQRKAMPWIPLLLLAN